MLSTTIQITTILTIFISTIHSATIDQVVAANSDLISQADTIDTPVVAITGTTPTATLQKVPTDLQSLNLAIVSAQASLTPTAPTSDPPSELQITRSFGLFANTIQELMVDYIFQLAYLKPVPNLQTDTYNQITYMNNNFGAYTNFMVGLVGEQKPKTIIQDNANEAIKQINNATTFYT